MPSLNGAAKEGRLIYLFNPELSEVFFVWIYTHAEFSKRPPDSELKRAMQNIFKNR